jgi:excinuclease ABC subunit B
MHMTHQRVYVSATPGPFEFKNSRPDNTALIPRKRGEISAAKALKQIRKNITPSGADQDAENFDVRSPGSPLIVEQIIRPTGLLDPVLTLKPLKGQIDETIEMCRDRVEKNERVLVTTLTKKTAEDLADYLQETGLKVSYIHADVGAIERVEILRSLRAGDIDVLVGINLLREGLDLPEVSLVCILDADKEGFLRNETTLIQTAGRAARHVDGECVLFCDVITDSIQALIDVTKHRRSRQIAYNKLHGITPKSVVRAVQESLSQYQSTKESADTLNQGLLAEDPADYNTVQILAELEKDMREAAAKLEFERAAHLRDQIKQLKEKSHSASTEQD